MGAAGAELAAFTIPSGLRKTPEPESEATCTPKSISKACGSSGAIAAVTNAFPLAPKATCASGSVPDPFAASEYGATVVASTAPEPSALMRRVVVRFPRPRAATAPAYDCSGAESVDLTRRPAVQKVAFQVLCEAPLTAFTPTTMSCEPAAVEPLSTLAVVAAPNEKAPVPSPATV